MCFSTKNEHLAAIASKIVICQKCDLWKTRKNAVPGEGKLESPIIFIGEAPGYQEDLKGQPFVGAAGKFLDTLLSEAGLLREDAFITNVVKCRPPKNRKPLSKEIKICTQYLDEQIQAIRPELIVTLGSCSTAYFFSKLGLPFDGITNSHGRFYEASVLEMQVEVFPTFHPAAALYSGRYRDLLRRDFQILKNHPTTHVHV